MEEIRDRIPKHIIGFMVVIALYYDTLQALISTVSVSSVYGFFLAILSTFITIFAWLHFYVWFKLRNVNFFEGKMGKVAGKRLAPFLITMAAELIPGLNVAPVLTIGIAITAVLVHLEDLAVRKKLISEAQLLAMQKHFSGRI